MTKTITDSQILGELGETAVKKLVLEMQFIYDQRGRLEAGTDGIIELRDRKTGAPLGKLLGVQVKATASGKYIRETDRGFEYLLKPDDLKYWRGSNIPVIIVLWRQSDGSAYWKDATDCVRGEERRLKFDKDADIFDTRCVDRIGALTIDRGTPGVYLPPLSQGEQAIINLLRIRLVITPVIRSRNSSRRSKPPSIPRTAPPASVSTGQCARSRRHGCRPAWPMPILR